MALTVSLCVVAYNEEKYLPSLFADLSRQSYPHELTEIVLVDGASTDKTKTIMDSFASENHSFKSIRVFNNPKRLQACGWNIALKNANSDVIIRIDAHTHIPSDFTEKNIRLHNQGEMVTGGVRPCIIDENTPWKKALLEAENSMFGSSISKSRRKSEKTYVKTMFHAAYRREVIEKTGLFNEHLRRTEDNEYHYRVRQNGYKLCYDPQIVSYQYARSSLRKMVKQKYGNGYWIGLTLGICPKCISIYHLVPLFFVAGICLTTVLAVSGVVWPAIIMWTAYLLFSYLSAILSLNKHNANLFFFLFPFIFLILHVSYGVGSVLGIARIPFFRIKNQ